MSFRNGKLYTVTKLDRSHQHWDGVEQAVIRRTKPGTGPISLLELWDVRWRKKPFKFSWTKEFRPNRRLFFHGTTKAVIQKILDEGFKTDSIRTSRMLGNGVYATYHTNKGRMYGTDNYVLSVMIYAPRTLCFGRKETVFKSDVASAHGKYDAIEVRRDTIIAIKPQHWTMQNHEICVFDTTRAIPRFILKLG